MGLLENKYRCNNMSRLKLISHEYLPRYYMSQQVLPVVVEAAGISIIDYIRRQLIADGYTWELNICNLY